MSIPNPFSSSNVLEHIIAPKVVGSSGGYRVAVDLVDVDTVYSRQVGSSANPVSLEYLTQLGTPRQPVSNGYFNNIGSPDQVVSQAYFTNVGSATNRVVDLYAENIYWNNFIPTLPSGGGGSTMSFLGGTGIELSGSGYITTISSLIASGPGIQVATQPVGDQVEYVISNLTSVTGGNGVQVTQDGNVFNVSSDLAIVAGSSNVTIGVVGNTYSISVSASTGSTSIGITGPTGEIVYTTPSGIRSTPNVVYTGTTFNIPSTRLSTPDQGGILDISTYQTDVYIESGFADIKGAGNFITFTAVQGTTAALSIDTINNRVGVLTDQPQTTLDVRGQTEITFDASNGAIQNLILEASGISGSYAVAEPGTYILSGWGAGGSSQGGTGGAGGYASAEVTFNQPGTVTWSGAFGGSGGGGNALVVSFNGTPFLYIPGGGAGSVGGIGAAAQESRGLPLNMGGISSTTPGQTASAFYDDPQNYIYTTTRPISTIGGLFHNAIINGLTSTGESGTNITFSPPATQTNTGSSIVYSLQAYTQVNINPVNVVFPGTTFSSADSTITVPSIDSTGIDSGTPTTGITGNDYALYDNWPGNTFPSIQGDPPITARSMSSFLVGVGNVTWSAGSLSFNTGPDLYTFTFTGPILDPPPGNKDITFTGNVTMKTNIRLPLITNANISTDARVIIPERSTIPVSYRKFINYGARPSGSTGAGQGGGGYVGGGGAALVTGLSGIVSVIPGTVGNTPAGGGAGSWGFVNIPGLIFSGGENAIGGHGIFPYLSPFNPTGQYGFGGTTGSGGSQFLVIQQEPAVPITLPALTVNGDTTVTGIIRCDTNIQTSTIFLPDDTGTTFFQINADRSNLTIKNSSTVSPTGGDNFFLGSNGNIGLGDGSISIDASNYSVDVGPRGSTAVDLNVSGIIRCDTNIQTSTIFLPDNTGSNFFQIYSDRSNLRIKNSSTVSPTGGDNFFLGSNGNIGLGDGSISIDASNYLVDVGPRGSTAVNLRVSGNSILNGVQIRGTNTLSIGSNAYLVNQGNPNILANVGGVAALSIEAGRSTFNTGGLSAVFEHSTGNFTAQDFIARSDARIKDNVVTIDSALDKVMRMRGVYYDDKDGIHNVGVIAQEVEEVLPEVVHTDENDMKSVSYGRIVGLLIEAIKEQQEIIKGLTPK